MNIFFTLLFALAPSSLLEVSLVQIRLIEVRLTRTLDRQESRSLDTMCYNVFRVWRK